jgi:hydroxymethylglutaryl-CoA synthase
VERVVGIDHLGVYTPGYVLPLADLAAVRGVAVDKIHIGIGAREMSVAPPWEDTVTLAANAALRALAAAGRGPDEIGMLLVGTETAVDHAKPIGAFLHELLGLPSACRTVELKHACYGGTAGMMLALEWLRSGGARGRKALVIASDIARYDLHSSAEFTQGAGAVALLLSESPALLELDPISGVYARNVYDFWRPLDRREAMVDGKFSIDCYLDALDGALRDFHHSGGDAAHLATSCAALLYHAPFPKMTYKAHQRLLEHEAVRLGADAEACDASYARLVEPSLGAARRVGNTYTASLYVCLAWLAEQHIARLARQRLGLFSYGSGSCAEFFSGRFADGAARASASIGLAAQLDRRQVLSVDEYEAFARAAAGGEPALADGSSVRFVGVRNDRRIYAHVAVRS